MSLIDSIIFGALQGVTEFLPISSSGHLILLANFFQVEFPTIVFEVVVHLGTLISILFIFRSDIISIINKVKIKKDFQEIILISSATIPIALTGLIFKSNIEIAFRSVAIVGVCMVVTGIILGSTLFTSSVRKKNISLISIFNSLDNKEKINLLLKKKINVFSLDLLPRITRAQSMDVLSSQANLAGYKVMSDLAEKAIKKALK